MHGSTRYPVLQATHHHGGLAMFVYDQALGDRDHG
jgi:hypothetical protein